MTHADKPDPPSKRRLLALVNPRAADGSLKTAEQIYAELRAQMDTTRCAPSCAHDSTKRTNPRS